MIIAIGSDREYLNTLSHLVHSMSVLLRNESLVCGGFSFFDNAESALSAARSGKNVAVIIDVDYKTRPSLETIKEFRKCSLEVIVVTSEVNDIDSDRARKGGASLYVSRRKYNEICLDIIDLLSSKALLDSLEG